MIRYFEGTVFNANAQAIVNTVNCTGVMGAGIALEFMLRYPGMFEDYESKCKDKKIIIGKVDYYKNADYQIIVNFPTKWHFKYPSKLIWIEQGLQDFAKSYKHHNITSVAFPKLGTSNGGLSWSDVKRIMEKHLSSIDIDVYICLDDTKEAEGIEKAMLEKLNVTTVDQMASIVKLNSRQRDILFSHMPYNRFWKVGETESIGLKTYSTIFRHFYSLANGTDEKPSQLSLFEM